MDVQTPTSSEPELQPRVGRSVSIDLESPMENLLPTARVRRGRSQTASCGPAAILAIAVLVLACATSATASERRARLSSDLTAHLNSSSSAPIDIIISGSQERIDRLARRHGLVVKKVLSSGAVLTASKRAMAALSQDAEVDLTVLRLDSNSTARTQRNLRVSVKEIGDSLELRRVLGLIQQGDQSAGQP